MQVKKAIFALLTTLFVSVMTLQASFAQIVNSPSAGDCTTVEMVQAMIGEAVKNKNGTIELLNKTDLETYIKNASEMSGPAPFAITAILIVAPENNAEIYSVGYFTDGGCLAGRPVPIPAEIVLKLLERKPA